ncbi:MAG: response regulator [Acidobacteria bacterium]|nr:response regulator [Acidobacteriota bacterium]MCI0626901.1 response regulator [Acidobacteriota bacterium]MCI0723474.1 response regulator [Acidobacteriota bacterium]
MSTILIVDDEKNLLRLYEKEFRLDGYSVITANSGVEALHKLESNAVNLVILDIRMPELDGVETLKRIMELPSKPPIILNSAYTSYKDNFLTWAAAAYVVKSSDVTELKTKAKEVLEKQA